MNKRVLPPYKKGPGEMSVKDIAPGNITPSNYMFLSVNHEL